MSNSVNVSVAVNGDPSGLGVDWNLLCGGSPVAGNTNPCGTITPVHVGSNIDMIYLAPPYVPVGNTATLTARATSNPSQSVSATLTILPKPATVQFTQGFAPPSSMAAGGTAQMAATVTNDPTFAGAQWSVSCGGSSCGSFLPTLTPSGGAQGTTVYTAPPAVPPGGTVTVKATSAYSQTGSPATATIQIMPISVGVTIAPAPLPIGVSGTLTATVLWDATNSGVSWGVPGGCGVTDCGIVTAASCTPGGTSTAPVTTCTATYNPPSAFPAGSTTFQVAITATSLADMNQSGAVNFTVSPPPPITVSLTATPNAVQVGGTTRLDANVTSDFSNMGVSWQCDPACGLTSTTTPISTTPNSATYEAKFTPTTPIPSGTASATINIKATSIAAPTDDPTGSASTTLTIYQPISVLITPPPVINVGTPATFSATVNNDIASGGVDWTASGCASPNCGTFSPSHSASGANVTYTAPTHIRWPGANPAVTITATSTASGTVPPSVFTSLAVPVTPDLSSEFVPFAPSTLPVGNPTASSPTLISLTATAANDATNQGVDWTVTCPDASGAACGQFLKAPEMVATAATADIPATFWAYGSKVHAAGGQAVAYEPPTHMPSGGMVTLAAASTANPDASTTQIVTITNNLSGPALTGKVQAGKLPVSGASVQLIAAGNTGYGSAATPLVISNGGTSVTTGDDGSFAIPAGFTCPSLNTLVYLVALGGRPGGPSSPANPQLGFITAVGPCSGLDGTTPLVMNEVTTVGSVFALAPFIGGDYAHIGSSSSNYNNGPNLTNASNNNNGLANAFATVNNLVDITSGQALVTTPAGTGTVPQAEINTLADAINTCAATAGGAPGDGSPCDAFFEASNVNPPGGGLSTTANAPTSILQAVIEEAQVPSTVRATPNTEPAGLPLYTLVANTSYVPQFTPILTAAPYDWSIALSYSGGGLEGQLQARPVSSSLAFDAAGNVWVSNKRISSVTELSNTGAALSPFATGTTLAAGGGFKGGGLTSPKQVVIDPYGSAWVLNLNGSVTELASTGAALSGTSGFSGGGNASDSAVGIAVDGNGNAWVAASGFPGDVAEYAGYNGGAVNGTQVATGAPLSPGGVGFVNGINSPNGAIAVDGSNNVWVLNQGDYSAAELSGANGQLLIVDQGDLLDLQSGLPLNPPQYLLSANNFGISMAIDHAGNIFIPSTTSGQFGVVDELLAGASTSNFGGVGRQVNLSILLTGEALYPSVAIDGSGNIWAMVTPLTGTISLPLSLGEWSPSGGSLNSNHESQGFVASSITVAGISTVAVDASGSVWVLSGVNPTTVTEFVGVAAPVVTPVSVAVQKNKLGTRP